MRVDVFRVWVTNPVGRRQELKRDTAIDRKLMEIIRHQGSPRPYGTGPGPALVQYFAFIELIEIILVSSSNPPRSCQGLVQNMSRSCLGRSWIIP